MQFRHPLLISGLGITTLLVLSLLYVHSTSKGKYETQNIRFDYREEAEKESAKKGRMQPETWEDISHGGQLGFLWRDAQQQTLDRIRTQYYAGDVRDRNINYGPFIAKWIEKGPSKIPGRVTGSEVLYAQNRIYLLTDGGYLFRGTLIGNDWECLNNHHPLTRDVSGRLEVIVRPDGSNRILVGGWDAQNLGNTFLKYSDDEGQTWQQPAGIPAGNWYRRTLASDAGKVWHLIRSDASGAPAMKLLFSSDFGSNFIEIYSHNLTQGYYDRRCDFWKPADSDTIFAVFEDKMVRIAPDGAATNLGIVSEKPDPEWVILTGGRTDASQPYTLYCRIWDGSENGVYRSTDSGQTWDKWGVLQEGLHSPFSLYSFVTNPVDPGTLYSGGWIVGTSSNGTTWANPHDLGGYVGYHGDVPDMNFAQIPGTQNYELFIGTDGGFYKYLPQENEFESLSTITLNNTQIYKMASDHETEHRMYIGTQDNGFNYNLTPASSADAAPFSYLWGGDVTQVTSGDGGKSVWCFWIGSGCNYIQNAAQIQTSGIANWGPVNDSGYWETPAKADPINPDECLVAGHKPPSTTGSYLIRLKAPDNLQNAELKPLEVSFGDYNFQQASNGGRIGAISISPLDNNHIYVMTDNGVFFWSLDKGITWQKNEAARNKLWVRYIAVSPTQPGEVLIGGAGYDNNTPCWRTSNHGQTMVAAEPVSSSELKDNRVNALCFDPEGKYVFAAADIGAFVYVIAEQKWQVISGNPAPVSHFHDVEYLENSNTVRFATYARGVWDFKIEGLVSGTNNLSGAQGLTIYPNPATDWVTVQTDMAQEIMIADASGRKVYQQQLSVLQNGHQIPVNNWPAGTYFVFLRSVTGQVSQATVFVHE